MKVFLVPLLLSSLVCGVIAAEDTKRNFGKWEKEILAFESPEAKQAPASESVLFVGSSSIRLWDLPKYFPNRDFINHGFGGSHIIDSIHFADRIILNYRPRTIVFYAGDNDVTDGKSPLQVQHDFRQLAQLVRQQLPETRIVFIAIKPSINRWKLAERMKQANDLIAADCSQENRLHFVDIWKPMLGEDGKPRRELFAEDGLHLSPTGYQLWTKLVTPHLTEK